MKSPDNFLVNLAPYAKAVAAFLALLLPVLAVLIQILVDISNGGNFDWGNMPLLAAALAALGGGTFSVYQVSNMKEQ